MRSSTAVCTARVLALALACSASACKREPEPMFKTRTPTAAAQAAWFSDVTASSGVDFVHDAGLTPEKHLPETMGAGAAIVDVNEDGRFDLYFVQGGPMRAAGAQPGSFSEPPGPLPTNRLFLNVGGLLYVDGTRESGAAADTHYGMGVAAGDADGDGHVDLFLTNLGPVVLLAGDGKAHFTDVTERSGIRDERWTSGATFFDADDDGDLDLYVCAYVEIDLAHPQWCGEKRDGWRSACHPDHYKGLQDRFWRNQGDGKFEDATISAGLADNWGKGLGVLASDLDGDGATDLYVANDNTENRLWHNRGDGTFEDATLLSGTGLDRYGRTKASMGLASGDVDGDLDLEIFVTGFDDESDSLYVNQKNLVFEDASVRHGLEHGTRLPVGFGCLFEDFDQDADLDLAIINGHIIDNIRLYHDGQSHAQRALLYVNDGLGGFTDSSARGGGLTARPLVGRGIYSGDLDGDLDPDLVVTQCGGQALILRNDVGTGNALAIRGLPPATRVRLNLDNGRELLRESGPQPSYFGQCAPEILVGLGSAGVQRLRVEDIEHPGEAEVVSNPQERPEQIRFAPEGCEVELVPPLRRGRIDFPGKEVHVRKR